MGQGGEHRAGHSNSDRGRAVGEVAGRCAATEEAVCCSSCLGQGTRYPFVPKVSASAKESRSIRQAATRYESTTTTDAAHPRARTGNGQVAVATDPCPRTVRGRVQDMPSGAATVSPSSDKDTALTRSQTTTARAANRPQTGCNLGFSASEASSPTRLSRELKQPTGPSKSPHCSGRHAA